MWSGLRAVIPILQTVSALAVRITAPGQTPALECFPSSLFSGSMVKPWRAPCPEKNKHQAMMWVPEMRLTEARRRPRQQQTLRLPEGIASPLFSIHTFVFHCTFSDEKERSQGLRWREKPKHKNGEHVSYGKATGQKSSRFNSCVWFSHPWAVWPWVGQMPSLSFSFCLHKMGRGWVDDPFVHPFNRLSSPLGSGDQVMAKTRLLLSRSLQPGARGKYQLEELITKWSKQGGEN